MKNTTHRVVILKNVNSDMISQAILILKDSVRENETNLMEEAERIVEKYMNTKPALMPKSNNKLTAGILSLGVILIGIGIFIASRFV